MLEAMLNPTINKLEEYKVSVENLAKNRNSLLFDNKGVEHASIVLSTIFNTSQDEVRIYAQNMNGDISDQGDYFEALNNYLSSDKRLYVLLDEAPIPESKSFALVKFISQHTDNAVSLKIANDTFRAKLAQIYNLKDLHFCIGDDHMFRIEINPETHKALCSFHNHSHSQTLKDLFDDHFPDSKAIA